MMDMGFEVSMQSHPHCHCVLRLHPRLLDIAQPNGFCHVNLDNAYEHDPHRRQRHFHGMFMEAANRQLASKGIDLGAATNCRPRLSFPDNRKEAMTARLSQYPRPWLMICPRSDSFNVRQVPDGIWSAAAAKMNGTVFWLGRHPAPPNIVDMNCRHFDTVLDCLSVADLLCSVDTGPMHVAAALGVPLVAISQSSSPELHLNDQNDFVAISPSLDCLNCQLNVCPKNADIPPCQNIDPELISSWANARVRHKSTEDVSAIIAIYQPEVSTLNKCLECIIPQVQEVIVSAEGNSVIPHNALKNSKVRYVRNPMRKIGVGRNFNFGARHGNGKYLLIMNDDVLLDPGAVEAMKKEMTDGVGAVSHFLRYPSGEIYYAGKVRSPGVMGWGHLNHRQYVPSWTTPQDCENMCGASVMIRRDAWFQVGGFDEDFFIYCEDDALMLGLRRNGWKLRYTPSATGVHYEGQSTRKIGGPNELVRRAGEIFNEKWGNYLRHNINRCPMGNFDYS